MPFTKSTLLLLVLSLFGPCLATDVEGWREQFRPDTGRWDASPRRKCNYNNLWTLGYYHNRTEETPNIVRMKTTLEVPPFPALDADTEGALGFWPGLESAKGEIIQSVVAHYVKPPPIVEKGSQHKARQFWGNHTNWGFFPNYFREGDTRDQTGEIGLVGEGQNVSIEYWYEEDEKRYHQRMSVDGEGQITLPTTVVHGPMALFAPRIEANDGFYGPIPAHRYFNTTIWLDKQDPNFAGTLETLQNATTSSHNATTSSQNATMSSHNATTSSQNATMSSRIETPDRGWVWHIDLIHLAATKSEELRPFDSLHSLHENPWGGGRWERRRWGLVQGIF